MVLTLPEGSSLAATRNGPTADDREAILDFLEYDSKIRKIERRNEFEELQDGLKRRYEPVLKRRLQNTRR